MDVSTTPLAERIARVLAGMTLSVNGEGAEESVAQGVDNVWRDHLDQARAVLRTLREPDRAMAAVGDVAVWERMILAAIDGAMPTAAH